MALATAALGRWALAASMQCATATSLNYVVAACCTPALQNTLAAHAHHSPFSPSSGRLHRHRSNNLHSPRFSQPYTSTAAT